MYGYYLNNIKPAYDRIVALLDEIDPLECEHEDTEIVEVSAPFWDNDSHTFQPTGTAYETECTRCHSTYNEANETWETP